MSFSLAPDGDDFGCEVGAGDPLPPHGYLHNVVTAIYENYAAIYGRAPDEVDQVEAKSTKGSSSGVLLEPPEKLDLDGNFFVVIVDASFPITVVARDEGGWRLGSRTFAPLQPEEELKGRLRSSISGPLIRCRRGVDAVDVGPPYAPNPVDSAQASFLKEAQALGAVITEEEVTQLRRADNRLTVGVKSGGSVRALATYERVEQGWTLVSSFQICADLVNE
jgi:hypothetical protein